MFPNSGEVLVMDVSTPGVLGALGNLRIAQDVPAQDLNRALNDVRAALEEGQNARSILTSAYFDVPADESFSLKPFVGSRTPEASAGDQPQKPARTTLVNIRSFALPIADPLRPDWTRAMRVNASRGPFLNELGQELWIDTFKLPKLVTVLAQAGPTAMARTLIRLPLAGSLSQSHRARLGRGSVWLGTRIFADGRPAHEFVGLRISGGSVRFEGVTSATNTIVTLSDNWRFALTLQPERVPTPETDGGDDAANTVVNFPNSITITFDATGASTIEFEDISATAYGTSINLTRGQDPCFYDPISRSIVFACSASKPAFRFAKVRSKNFRLNTGSIARSGWALPAIVVSPDVLGEASGIGFAWMEFTAPTKGRWHGIQHTLHLPKTVLGLAIGEISVWAAVETEDVVRSVQLWDEAGPEPPRQSGITITSVTGSSIFYVNQPGSEVVVFDGRVDGHLDRPLQVDGRRVALHLPIGWLVSVNSPASRDISVIATDPKASSAPHIAFALENALLKVRPPTWLSVTGTVTGKQLGSGKLLLRCLYRVLLNTLPDPYAANFDFDRRLDVDQGWTDATVFWSDPASPRLGFSLEPGNRQGTALAAAANLADAQIAAQRGLESMNGRVLLDVSSNCDQFGVLIPVEAESVRVQGLGVVAQASDVRHGAGFISAGNSVFFNKPEFKSGLSGGMQLAIRGRANSNTQLRDPTLPGYVELRNENQYAKGVLTENIQTRFNGDFGPASPNGVPVRRYDWSGYGASLFSDWHDPEAVGPAIIEARFDVLVGRTAHEVIQMQSILYPWFIRVVRIVTIDRTPGGWILREDSGWVATSDGRFAYLGDPKGVPPLPMAFGEAARHPGAVEALTNVRHIQLSGAQFDMPASSGGSEPITWQAVNFDADVLFVDSSNPRLAVAEGSSGRIVPTRNVTGWIQIGGPAYTAKTGDGQTVQRTRPAGAQEIFDLLKLKGEARAPIACAINLGGEASNPGMVFRSSRIDVSCNNDRNNPQLVVVVRGSPVLPRDGAWSMTRMLQTDTAPKVLDPGFPLPLISPNKFQAGFGHWHLADPVDITLLGDAATPSIRYSLLQSLGAQKILFSRPRVGNDADPITLPQTPQLADMGSLLNAAGIFPGLGESFDFQKLKTLTVRGGDLGFKETFVIGSPTATVEAMLADLGGADNIQVVIAYHDENGKPTTASIEVDPVASPRWQLTLSRACFAVRFKGNPLISIYATVKADEKTAPTVADLCVHYEGILNALETIFSNIQQVARFLPGGVGAGLKVALSQGHLTVHNGFSLPSLPLGAGEITDIAVDMGLDVALSPFDVRFAVGLGSSKKPFRWVVSPLAGTGVVQVAIARTGLDILVQGGLGLGLAIDLGIAAGSASITLAVELNTGPDPFEVRGILSGRASVDVLQGLVSATITLAAGLGIIPPPELFSPPFLPPQLLPPPKKIPSLTVGLTASVSVGIHISVCWVVDVDWDGYWQFRQDISTPEIAIPV